MSLASADPSTIHYKRSSLFILELREIDDLANSIEKDGKRANAKKVITPGNKSTIDKTYNTYLVWKLSTNSKS